MQTSIQGNFSAELFYRSQVRLFLMATLLELTTAIKISERLRRTKQPCLGVVVKNDTKPLPEPDKYYMNENTQKYLNIYSVEKFKSFINVKRE